ncbi:MAG: STAS domain-containing protein [Fibrobacterota bacterium]
MEITQKNDSVILSLGTLNTKSGRDFLDFARKVCEDNEVKEVKVDLAETEDLTSMMLGMLVRITRELDEKGQKVLIINPKPEDIETFQLSSLDKVLNISVNDPEGKDEEDESVVDLGLELDFELVNGISKFIFSGIMNKPADTRLFRMIYEKALKDSDRFLLDFSEITFIDSEAVAEILALYKKCGINNCSVRICGASEILLELMDVCSVRNYIPVYSNTEEALKNW